MNKDVKVRTSFLIEECKRKGVQVSHSFKNEPIDFGMVWNKNGDMASISASSIVYEPAMYNPEWSEYMKNWAKQEGFKDTQIKKQNLIREVTMAEALEYLCND